jgi:D-alanyl-lipoteichoic acid acyltransferase DltB (MBOAT superfamily)
VFVIYWFVLHRRLKIQNTFLVIASYVFYGWWDWRFLSLIIFSSLVDYWVGIGLSQTEDQRRRKWLLILSLCVNLGLLGFFKYFNFFIESFADAFTLFGRPIAVSRLNILLPVGISFYTFQTLSYSIDVYKRKITPTRDGVAFFAFVSFFPQLVAGPIERAGNLLPQFYKIRQFEYDHAACGMRQILWGVFKKVVIADNCAEFVNLIFNPSADHTGSTLLLGGVLFAFQIYGDFSGYSDIAIGTAKLLGFHLKRNFAFPYFSRDIAEFWRRWHISLSSWFRDYLYIPLGGSRKGTWVNIRNLFVIFVVSGFWHGANWTFIVWGALNALYFLPLFLLKRNRRNLDTVASGKWLPSVTDCISMVVTFGLTVFAWIFFRAETIGHAVNIIGEICSNSLFTIPLYLNKQGALMVILLLMFFIMVEWFGRHNQYAIEKVVAKCPQFIRWTFYSFIMFLIGAYMQTTETPFIYFQF